MYLDYVNARRKYGQLSNKWILFSCNPLVIVEKSDFKHDWTVTSLYGRNYVNYYFKDGQDAALFALKYYVK